MEITIGNITIRYLSRDKLNLTKPAPEPFHSAASFEVEKSIEQKVEITMNKRKVYPSLYLLTLIERHNSYGKTP
jgi:hypothetical protein